MNMTADTMLRDPPLATRESYHALEREYGARNYKPFDVVLTRGLGIWLWDVDGRRDSIVCQPIGGQSGALPPAHPSGAHRTGIAAHHHLTRLHELTSSLGRTRSSALPPIRTRFCR